ncbi:MAG: hypothetical protein ABI476_05860 [Oxalobacteraceae bacterium]
MKIQIEAVRMRDGDAAATAYARQTLAIYRKCVPRLPNRQQHFAHHWPFRPHFVKAMLYLRAYLRTAPGSAR